MAIHAMVEKLELIISVTLGESSRASPSLSAKWTAAAGDINDQLAARNAPDRRGFVSPDRKALTHKDISVTE